MQNYFLPSAQGYTPEEVAKILNIKVGTVYSYLSRGYIRGYHLDRRRVITEAQLHAYMNRPGQRELIDHRYATVSNRASSHK